MLPGHLATLLLGLLGALLGGDITAHLGVVDLLTDLASHGGADLGVDCVTFPLISGSALLTGNVLEIFENYQKSREEDKQYVLTLHSCLGTREHFLSLTTRHCLDGTSSQTSSSTVSHFLSLTTSHWASVPVVHFFSITGEHCCSYLKQKDSQFRQMLLPISSARSGELLLFGNW